MIWGAYMKPQGNMGETLKTIRNTNILVIIASVTIGLIYIFSPLPAMEVICYIIAAAMCVYGVFTFVEYFVKSNNDAFGSFGLVKGVTLVVFGVFVFLNPSFITNMLAVLVGIAMIIDGVAKAQYAVDLLRLKSEKWWYSLIPAAIVFILGAVIAFNPAETAKGFMIFVGVSLLVCAASDIFSIFFLSHCVKKLDTEETEEPEIPEIENE